MAVNVNIKGIDTISFPTGVTSASVPSPGVLEIDLSGSGGGGITSINSDTTAAQLLVAGTGMTITNDGVGGHTFNATGGTGDVSGPSSSVNGDFVQFNGTTGKIVKDGGLSLTTDGTLAANSDSLIPSEKAVKTYVDAHVSSGVLRKVGLSFDGAGSVIQAGSTSSVQVDFFGTIIGWSIEADQAGSITIDVCKKSGTQIAPAIPATSSDKISASAPINLALSQAKGVGPSGVSTWNVAVSQWDSIKFNVQTVSVITAATVWVTIQQT